jgi:MarR family transcriptional regulator for hemolysin
MSDWRMAIDHDTGYFVTWTSRAFLRVGEARLRSLGLGVAHLPVLVCLAEEEPLTQREIARRVHVEQPTAAALLQRMTRAGLIEKSDDPSDRRASRIRLSAHAREVLPEALDLLSAVNAAATADLSPAEVAVLHDLLGRVLSNLNETIDGLRSGPDD